jgi:hypothetical protein
VPQNRRGRFSARAVATFPHFVVVQALAVRGGFVELVARGAYFMPRIAISAFDAMMRASSSTRAFRARADEVIPQGAFAAVHESESGTFET